MNRKQDMTIRIGELFAGYGGLGMGVQSVIGGEVVWFSEFDAAPSKILAHHWPDIPNHGDITLIDWASVEPVDVLTGGFPCQDVSLAGARAGLMDGTRSGLWSEFAKGIAALRPGLVVIENVRGLLSAKTMEEVDEGTGDLEPDETGMGELERGDRPVLNAFGRVLGDLAELGYDTGWVGLRAADAGAPHGRYRVFIVAQDTNVTASDQRWQSAPGQAEGGRPRTDAGRRGGTPAADADDRDRHGWERPPRWRTISGTAPAWRSDVAAADADSHGQELIGRIVGEKRDADGRSGEDADGHGAKPATRTTVAADTCRDEPKRRGGAGDLARPSSPREVDGQERERLREAAVDSSAGASGIEWGAFEPAVARWELVTGRRAPSPTRGDGRDGGHRLSAQFVEWMMGLQEGHVTGESVEQWRRRLDSRRAGADGLPVGMRGSISRRTIGLTRNEQLKALGNGVVPQQAALAVRLLLERGGSGR